MKTNDIQVDNAIISASNRNGLEDLVSGLIDINPQITIISTTGTFIHLQDSLPDHIANFMSVRNYTGEDTGLDYTKLLSTSVFASIMAGNDSARLENLEKAGMSPIQLLVMNPYDFNGRVTQDTSVIDAMSKVDAGLGIALAAMKNVGSCALLSNPSQYEQFIEHLGTNGGKISFAKRKELLQPCIDMIQNHLGDVGTYLRNS